MLVNQQNGQLYIAPGLTLFHHQSLKTFTSREDYYLWQNIINDKSISGYMKETEGYAEQKTITSLFFVRDVLWCVELSFFLPTEQKSRFRESSYPNGDMLRWRFHEKFLLDELGSPPYNYDWGFISLGHSGIDRFAVIHIEYM